MRLQQDGSTLLHLVHKCSGQTCDNAAPAQSVLDVHEEEIEEQVPVSSESDDDDGDNVSCTYTVSQENVPP